MLAVSSHLRAHEQLPMQVSVCDLGGENQTPWIREVVELLTIANGHTVTRIKRYDILYRARLHQ